tara:strand:- start:4290 stop:4622 length:333 start_codon:yes stop_codon:yes gene_type:complete
MIKIAINALSLFTILFSSISSSGIPISDTSVTKEKQQNNSENSLDFFVIGDWGKGDFNQRNVANAMGTEASHNPIDFIISVGDNFYPHGVRGINDRRWKNTFEDVYSDSS